jgi:hypothetical protein
VTPAITVIRSRSFQLMVNVSMSWPGCYRIPAQGDILMEFVVRQKSVLPEAGDEGASLRQKGCYPITP